VVFSSSFNPLQDVYEIELHFYKQLSVSVAAVPESETKLEIQLLLHGAVIPQAAVMS